ncbi:MAG: hypothetical protein AB7K24_18950 [Gemmataceae bacterium]
MNRLLVRTMLALVLGTLFVGMTSAQKLRNILPPARPMPPQVNPVPVVPNPNPVPQPAARKSDRQKLIEIVDTLTATNLYQTYMTLGLIADGRVSNSYSQEETLAMLKALADTVDAADKQLNRLTRITLTQEEQARFTELTQVSTLLKQQGAALVNYVQNNNPRALEEFQRIRLRTGERVATLLR